LAIQNKFNNLAFTDEQKLVGEFDNLDPAKIHLKRQKEELEIADFWNDKMRYL